MSDNIVEPVSGKIGGRNVGRSKLRLLRLLPLFLLGSFFLIWLVLRAIPAAPLFNRAGGSHAIFDREGKLLQLTISSDERYRLWVPLSEIPQSMRQATLLQEDKWFYRHIGINPASIIRAFITTYITHERQIGASTITMQLARQRFNLNTRTISGKLWQIAYALHLERHYSKDEILEGYLNLIPYGGNVEGIGAAAIVYFVKPVRDLSTADAITLTTVPQSPTARTPQGGNVKLLEARNRMYERWQAEYGEREELSSSAPLVANSRRDLPKEAPHLVQEIVRRFPYGAQVKSAIDLNMQHMVERNIDQFVDKNVRLGVANASALLVDVRDMSAVAYVGSADFNNAPIAGQVNGLRGKRSPGSALKPFIYGLALDQGLIHSQTMLKDTPLHIAGYNPENFEKNFVGPLSATEALVRSRNVPAIFLTQSLKSPGLYGLLKSAEITKLRDEGYYGLALALGGVEVSMEELVGLYAMLVQGGEQYKIRIAADEPIQKMKRLLSQEASSIVLEMLRENPRAGADIGAAAKSAARIPWKTGTSWGFRDAWAVGIVGPYVLGVWVGNFDGKPNPNFVGREMAGPLFFGIADSIVAEQHPTELPILPKPHVRRIRVCSVSGALPGPHCHQTKDTLFIPGVSPITTCNVHREVTIDQTTGLRSCGVQETNVRREVFEFWPSDILSLFKAAGIMRRSPPEYKKDCTSNSDNGVAPAIISPQSGLVYAARGKTETVVPLQAVVDADVREIFWFIDDQPVGSGIPTEIVYWSAKPGTYVARVVDDQGRAQAKRVTVQVVSGE